VLPVGRIDRMRESRNLPVMEEDLRNANR